MHYCDVLSLFHSCCIDRVVDLNFIFSVVCGIPLRAGALQSEELALLAAEFQGKETKKKNVEDEDIFLKKS